MINFGKSGGSGSGRSGSDGGGSGWKIGTSTSLIATQVRIEPWCDGWKLSMITTTLRSFQQCNDKMSYLNQMYEKKAMARV